MSGPEKQIEQNIRRKLKKLGYLTYKIHTGQYQCRGFPDLLVVKHGITSYFEVKRPGEGPSPIQILRLRELRQHGCIAKPVWSDKDVIRALREGNI